MIGIAGIVGTFLPLLATAAAAWGPLRDRKLWTISLATHLISLSCFLVLVVRGFYLSGETGASIVASPALLAGNHWSGPTALSWNFSSASLCLAACAIMVSFHFIAGDVLEKSRASVAGLAGFLVSLLGALGSNHPLLFCIFLAGAVVPRLIFTGTDALGERVDAVKETAFLAVVALIAALISVLAFAEPFRATLPAWFKIEGADRIVLPGGIGLTLLLLSAAINAGLFPFHGSARRIFQLEKMERAVPLALQPVFGFALLFKFGPSSFLHEFRVFSPWLLSLFAIGVSYSAVSFLGARTARDRVFWLQQIFCSFIAVGFFTLTSKGWHGAQVLLFFQCVAVPFLIMVLACHERRPGGIPLHEITRYPAFALSTALAALFALFLPVSLGFYGAFLVTWSLVGLQGWILPFLIFSMPLVAFAGVRIMYFRLGEGERQEGRSGVAFTDLQRFELVAILPIGLGLLVLGMLPKLLMGPMGMSVKAALQLMGFKE